MTNPSSAAPSAPVVPEDLLVLAGAGALPRLVIEGARAVGTVLGKFVARVAAIGLCADAEGALAVVLRQRVQHLLDLPDHDVPVHQVDGGDQAGRYGEQSGQHQRDHAPLEPPDHAFSSSV